MTWSKKVDRYLRLGVRNYIEYTAWSKKLDRNVRHGVRNKNEMNDLD